MNLVDIIGYFIVKLYYIYLGKLNPSKFNMLCHCAVLCLEVLMLCASYKQCIYISNMRVVTPLFTAETIGLPLYGACLNYKHI